MSEVGKARRMAEPANSSERKTQEYRVSELWRYPVKSMAGESIDVAEVGIDGIAGDRRWAVRDLETGKVASAKKTRPFGALLHWAASTTDDGTVLIESPDDDAWIAGDPALDRALSATFDRPVAMVAAEDDRQESYDAEWELIPGALPSVSAEVPMAVTSASMAFVDASALHLVTEGALDHLGDLVGAAVAVERFRPTALLRSVNVGSPRGFVDLDWGEGEATLGGASLKMSGPTPRCVMTTLSQRGLDPLRAGLQALAVNARRDTLIGNLPCFGTAAEVTGPGTVRLGDRFAFTG